MDTYSNFMQLAANERYMTDYLIEHQLIDSPILIFTPHGGGIEPGTTELVKAIAGEELNYYTLTAKKSKDNINLHITSKNYDEPTLLKILPTIEQCVSLHGCQNKEEIIFIGGRDTKLKRKIQTQLELRDFKVGVKDQFLAESLDNITNKNKTSAGVQLEISHGLRKQMFEDISKAKGRVQKTPIFWKFVLAIRMALDPYDEE